MKETFKNKKNVAILVLAIVLAGSVACNIWFAARRTCMKVPKGHQIEQFILRDLGNLGLMFHGGGGVFGNVQRDGVAAGDIVKDQGIALDLCFGIISFGTEADPVAEVGDAAVSGNGFGDDGA